MAEDPPTPVDQRVITVLTALNRTVPLLSKDERTDLAQHIVRELGQRHPTNGEDGWAEKLGFGIAVFCLIALMLMVVAAAGIGVLWLAKAVL